MRTTMTKWAWAAWSWIADADDSRVDLNEGWGCDQDDADADADAVRMEREDEEGRRSQKGYGRKGLTRGQKQVEKNRRWMHVATRSTEGDTRPSKVDAS